MREIYDKIQGQTLGSWCIAHEKLPSSEDAASQGHEKSFALQISSYVWSGETPSFYFPHSIFHPKHTLTCLMSSVFLSLLCILLFCYLHLHGNMNSLFSAATATPAFPPYSAHFPYP